MILWDPIKGQKLHQIEHHQRYVTCCAFSSDGAMLACGSNDKTVSVWRVDLNNAADVNLIDLHLEEKAEEHSKKKEENESAPKKVLVNEGKAVSEWTVEDVCHWLDSLDCMEYADSFRKHHINGEELLALNENVLKNVLGIGKAIIK